MLLQLEIDFTVPYEFTPTYDELMWTMLNYGVLDVPCVEVKLKSKKRKKKS